MRGEEIEPLVEAIFFERFEASNLKRRARVESRRAAEAALVDAETRLEESELAVGGCDPAELAASKAAVESARTLLVERTRSTFLPTPLELRRRWKRLPTVERRRHIALVIDAVFLRSDRGRGLPDRVLALPFGTAPRDLPIMGRRAQYFAPFDWGD